MKKTYLSRLFAHSRLAGMAVVVFMAAYAFVSFKSLNFIFFPLNDMYSGRGPQEQVFQTYSILADGRRVSYSRFPYWKKDLMESSLKTYAEYLLNGKKTMLQDYFERKGYPEFFTRALCPDSLSVVNWPRWYIHMAGLPAPSDSIVIRQYSLSKSSRGLTVVDTKDILKENIND